jgi:hypothetical protein
MTISERKIMQKNRRSFILSGIILLVLISLGCGLTASPTQDLQPLYTQAAVTFAAEETAHAVQTASARLTSASPTGAPASTATASAAASTDELVATAVAPATASASPTGPATTLPIIPEPEMPATPEPAAQEGATCDQAALLGDLSIAPDTLLLPGARFNKIWRIQNTGSCTWSTSYSLAFSGGDALSNFSSIFLPGEVAPGSAVDLAVPGMAPFAPGVYQGYWMLRNALGASFGVGEDHLQPLRARIRVFQPAVPGAYSYNFTADYCNGGWQSSISLLPCPGTGQDSQGSVLILDHPALESQTSFEYGLWTRPDQRKSGLIKGWYPSYTIVTDDHFLVELACLQGNPACDVIFEVDYQVEDGPSGVLGRWREVYDGATTHVDVDLSPLAGRRVQFTLLTANNGDASAANGFWLAPRIQNMRYVSNLALTWTQEGSPKASSCYQLQIFLTSQGGAEASASTCADEAQEIGRTPLTPEEYFKLIVWLQQLTNFSGEVYDSSAGHAVVSWLDLHGTGASAATDTDIRLISSFAAGIFERISE